MLSIPPAPRPAGNVIRRVFVLQGDRRRWPDALRAGMCMAVPALIGWIVGDLTAGLIATIGAFAALYGSGRPFLNRGIHLGAIVVSFGIAVALGDWAATIPWVGVLTVSAIAVAAVLLCIALGVGPPGAYMFVLGCAAGTAAAPEHLSPWRIGLLVAGGGAVAWLAHMAGALVRPRGPEKCAVSRAGDAVARYIDAVGSPGEAAARYRAAQALHDSWDALVTFQPLAAKPGGTLQRLRGVNYGVHAVFAEAMNAAPFDASSRTRQLRDVLDGQADADGPVPLGRPHPAELLRRAMTPGSPSLVAAARAGAAVLAVGLIGLALGIDHSYWAMAAAALMLHQGLDWVRTLQRSLERQLGTLAGLVLTAGILALHPRGLPLVLLIGVLQFTIVMVIVRNYALAVVFITCAALTVATGGRAVSNVAELLVARGVDTLLGCQVALLVYVLTSRPRRDRRLAEAIARTLDGVQATLPHLVVGVVATSGARTARRDLHLWVMDLLPAYHAGIGGSERQREIARQMWPAVVATEQLAYRTLAAFWAVERGFGRPFVDPEDVRQLSPIVDDLAQALRTGCPPAEFGNLPPFAAPELTTLRAVLIERSTGRATHARR